MISIRHLHKKYQNYEVLKDINLELPRNGLVAIIGPSGCGKTTLLNCISGLLDYQGDIIVEEKYLNHLRDDELSHFRLKHYGFVFQDFKLFENGSVLQNVLFPLDTISNASKKRKTQKCLDLLDIVRLKKHCKESVYHLSGGEKQRVCIARALANDPKIILADEPTGALDSENAIQIMDILEAISTKALVLIVSHDKELMEKYADKIVEMKDGQIVYVSHHQKHSEHIFLPVSKNLESNKKPAISSGFLLNHTLFNIKKKKWRTIICTMVTSLGLIGVGLATNLSSSISSNIKAAYSSIVDDSKIMVSIKDNNEGIVGQFGGNYYEAQEIASQYPQYVKDIGINYYVDFESFFKDKNEVAIASTTYRYVIPGISIRHVNEFKWLDYEHGKMYPEEIEEILDDEVVLGLNAKLIDTICFGLKIERTIESFSLFLQKNELYFYFDVANNNWQYSDQQLVKVKGFILEAEACLYHSNHLWNEYFFEEQMRFPTTDNIGETNYYPWIMKKLYYFHTYGNTDEFLDLVMKDNRYGSFLFEIPGMNYYPWLYRNVDVSKRERVMFFLNTLNSIPPHYSNYFIDHCPYIKNPIYGSEGGYAIYPTSLMMGFSHFTYFSCSQDALDKTLDSSLSLTLYGNEKSNLPPGVISGHFSKSSQKGVIFENLEGNIIEGREPQNLDEIVISSSMAKELLGQDSPLFKDLYLAFSHNERITGNGSVYRDFIQRKMRIVGIVKSQKNVIYHHEGWTIRYFQSRLGVSIFDLLVSTISFDVKEKAKIKTSIAQLNKAFPQYETINPMQGINEGVDRVCFYLQIVLIVFSFVAVIISSLLLSISNYLHILENKKDVGLSRCIGINKKESKKFLFFHAGIMSLLSFLMASLELVIASVVISFSVSQLFSGNFVFSFNPLSLVYMLLLSLTISFISSFVISYRVVKINPLEAIKK